MGRIDRLRNLGSVKEGDDNDPTLAFILLFSLPICGLLSQLYYALKDSNNSNDIKKTEKNFTRLHFHDKVTICWYVIDAFTHLSIELGYLILALTSTAEKSDTHLGWLWREYGRADHRWAVRDPTVISIEILTVFVGILCLFQIYGTYSKSSWRHPLQIIVCVSELYGGWMTFCPEWVDGSKNLDTSDPILLWVYLVFMNGLWVVVPLLLLWDSFSRVTDVCDKSAARLDLEDIKKISAPSRNWWNAAFFTIVLYMILVPSILFSANGVPVKQ